MSYETRQEKEQSGRMRWRCLPFIYDESLARFHESTTPRSVKACSLGHEGRVGRAAEKLYSRRSGTRDCGKREMEYLRSLSCAVIR